MATRKGEKPSAGTAEAKGPQSRQERKPAEVSPIDEAVERMIVSEYAPPVVVTDGRGELLHLVGRAGRYLQIPAGAPTNNVFDLAQGSLRAALRRTLATAVASRGPAVRSDVLVEVDGRVERLRITARPLPGVAEAGLYVLVLENTGGNAASGWDEAGAEIARLSATDQLENELRTTRSSLRTAEQDVDVANEELRAANEELMSTNEELQAANEELQTSQEEMEVANEELRTRLLQLDAANSDLQYHFAGTNIITVFLDRELRILRCTPAASKLFNVLDSDLGRPFRDLAPRFVQEDVMEDVATVLRTTTPLERRVHHPDKSLTLLVRILPYRSQERKITGVGITLVDITDLERAEEAERRYGRLLLSSPDAILVWQLHGGIETWNRGAEQLYGFSAEEAKGKDPRELLRETYPRPWEEIETVLRDSGRWQGEIESVTKDGRALNVLATLALLSGDDGAPRLLQSDRDVTRRKAAEVERERLIDSLQDAERRKNEFLGVLSHELRNPLTPIRNSLYILDHVAPGGPQAQKAKAIIERQVNQLARLVDDLLEVTRVSRGKLQIRRVPLELRDLVERTAEDHRSAFADAGLALEVRAGGPPLWVEGDPARLAQVVGNLLMNAVNFTGRGGHVLLAIDEDPARHSAVIRVRDEGAGIHPDLLPHLFEPFTQGDRTLDRSRGGLGLGLALAKGLVDQHGGELRAASAGPGKGAEFSIVLPLVEAPAETAAAPAGGPLSSALRILVVDDNVDAAETLGEALRFQGHDVEIAHSGPEALEKARRRKPDVVLCDIGLPGMDGYEVARCIRSMAELGGVHLVAVTGYARPEDVAKAREAGFERHLAKPPTLAQIGEALRSVLSVPQGVDSA